MKPVIVRWPYVSPITQVVDRLKHCGAKRVRGNRTALEIPEECLAELMLCLGQDLDREPSHIALMRARTSAQGAACTEPARSSSRLRNNSARQAAATEPSSPVSRLSMSATATAERSSAESRRTSPSTWSTRALMRQSIAPIFRHGRRPSLKRKGSCSIEVPNIEAQTIHSSFRSTGCPGF